MTHLTETAMFNFVDRNLDKVSIRQQSNGLMVLKYKNKVFYKNLWTPEIQECRGTVVEIVDESRLRVIQRPFTKIFNLHERGTKIHRDVPVTATRKINGFMAALTWYDGAPLVSTTGSCDSPFAEMAREMLSETGAYQMAERHPGITWIFEIVHPKDPHIIPDEIGVYLLGNRETKWDTPQHFSSEHQLDCVAKLYGLKRPEWTRIRFGDLVKMNRTANHEGFVCWTEAGYELKLKSPQYLVTKFLARMREERFLETVESNPDKLKERIDEEFYPVVDFVTERKNAFADAGEQERITMIREFISEGLTQ